MLKLTAKILLISFVVSVPAQASETTTYCKQKTSSYKDLYEQNVHSELVNQLDLSRLGRKIFRKPLRSANANVFDEVADSALFTNRHARTALSSEQLVKGYSENEGPDVSQDLVVMSGEMAGLHPSYFVKDARGDSYLLKFDSAESPELATAAEVIASRFYFALGYNVPQYTVTIIPSDKLKAGSGAKFRDDSGFLKELTQESLDEYLLFAPQTADGSFRVSASKIISGESKGFFSLTGRRKNDPEDIVNHRDRREIRALSVFSAWINNTDVSESNTLDVLVTENGKTFLKHYLIDFNSSLGSAHRGAKSPMFGHEYTADFGEAAKAFLTLGFWEKPWQKRWREAGEKVNQSSAVGYFDNRELNPRKYKTQLPYETFKRLTRADGFWAAKQIMAFHDNEIRALVSAGKLTSPENAETISKILIERRDLIAKHWLSSANSLDDFKVESGKLIFTDLVVNYPSERAEARSYQVNVLGAKNKVKQKISVSGTEIAIDPNWFQNNQPVTLDVRSGDKAAFVRVTLNPDSVLSIRHQD